MLSEGHNNGKMVPQKATLRPTHKTKLTIFIADYSARVGGLCFVNVLWHQLAVRASYTCTSLCFVDIFLQVI
jgi:hypothetical protein